MAAEPNEDQQVILTDTEANDVDAVIEVVEHRPMIFDPKWPSARTIARVVIVTMVLIFVGRAIEWAAAELLTLFFLLFLSIFFAYLIAPLVKLVRRPFKAYGVEQYMPRSLAIVVAYVVVFLALSWAVSNVAPRAAEQAREFSANLPALSVSVKAKLNDLNNRFERLRLPEDRQKEITDKLTEMGTELGSSVTAFVGSLLLTTATYLPWFFLIPILAFFFLKDVNHFRLSILRMFPAGPYRVRAEAIMQDVNSTLAAYTRAQLTSCFLIGLLCTIAFYVLGVKYALLLGILAGVCEFVPLIGPLVIGISVVLIAAFGDDPFKAIWVALFLIVLRIAQDYIFYPRIVRGGIHLHPLMIILSVLAGEQLAGIPGVFLSIPIVAVGLVLYRNVLDHFGSRSLFASLIEEKEAQPSNELT